MPAHKQDIRIQRFVCILAVLALCLNGCKDPLPTADSIDQSLAGIWQMDREATWDAQFDLLKDKKLVTSQGEKEEARRDFNSLSFSISLGADAKWTSTQSNLIQHGEYRGHWSTNGNTISLVQTHEGDKRQKDKMAGIVKNGKLHLLHKSEDMEIPYVFRRQD